MVWARLVIWSPAKENPEDDSFQFKFIVPGSSFKQSVDLNTKQFANEKVKICSSEVPSFF